VFAQLVDWNRKMATNLLRGLTIQP